jgi:hypothetical protein
VEELSFRPSEVQVYLDKEAGEFVVVSDEDLRRGEGEEELENLPEWERDQVLLAQGILDSDRYISPPDEFELDEYSIMRRFCLSVADPDARDELLRGIAGRGAFRMFRETVRAKGLEESWYSYRDQELAEIARAWLREEGIPFVDDCGGSGRQDARTQL